MPSSVPTVYLAGPTVFEPDPDHVFAQMKQVCAWYGLAGLSPLDNQVGLDGMEPGADVTCRIVQADIALMRRADAGVFCLDGFRRGPEMDPGTAFEVGYMHALGKRLAGWSRDPRQYPDRVRDFFAQTYGLGLGFDTMVGTGGRSGRLRDPDGMLVHSEGCVQNAMVEVSITMSGGCVSIDTGWLAAFEGAVVHLARLLLD